MALTIAALVVVWLCSAVALSGFMARRGYDRASWWIVSMLIGPAAVPLALFELVAPTGRQPVVLQTGEVWDGDLDVVVHIDATPQSRDAARASAELLGPWLHRLTLVKVLPRSGGRLAERLATEELRHLGATDAPVAGLVLVFGPPESALPEYATTEGCTVAVLASGDEATTRAMRATGVVVLPGAPGVERMSAFRHRCGRATTTRPMSMAPFWGRPQMTRSSSHVLQEPAS
jgi:hypothetical protein